MSFSLGLWQSRVICNYNMPFLCKTHYSISHPSRAVEVQNGATRDIERSHLYLVLITNTGASTLQGTLALLNQRRNIPISSSVFNFEFIESDLKWVPRVYFGHFHDKPCM